MYADTRCLELAQVLLVRYLELLTSLKQHSPLSGIPNRYTSHLELAQVLLVRYYL